MTALVEEALFSKPEAVLGAIGSRVAVQPNGCWHWTGAIISTGYGWVAGKQKLAHRLAFELVKGTIPPRHDVDHVCHNEDLSCSGGHSCLHRRCLNPSHLRAATRRENNLAGRLGQVNTARAAAQTYCKYGHEYTDANTRITSHGTRACRACGRDRYARTRATQLAKGALAEETAGNAT